MQGALVYRKSYNKDVLFKVVRIDGKIAHLEGYNNRLSATSPLNDLVIASINEISEADFNFEKEIDLLYAKLSGVNAHVTGKILHIDGDNKYLKNCLLLYKKLGLNAYGFHVKEIDLDKQIIAILQQINPDILVITGHDAYNRKGLYNMDNYINSNYFVECLKKIRKYYSKDDLVIFAGACQSNFEALIYSGSNFASSPNRVNIDAYDPAIVAIKLATTSITKVIEMDDIYDYVKSKNRGISGVETYGKMRLIYR